MMDSPEAPRSRRLALCTASTARTGLITGGLLVLVMLASLAVANGVTALERFAWLRNDIGRLIFGLVMLIPVCRFLVIPRRMFASALIGWSVFAIGYDFAGMYFSSLFTALGRTPFEVFVLGMIFYGVAAVLSWVAWMVLAAMHGLIVPARRRIHLSHHHQ
jgi:hypothetical protein